MSLCAKKCCPLNHSRTERCMKSYPGCEKKSVLEQTTCSLTSVHERSVRRTQSLIFQARVQGKVADLHALQKQLCDSFCAKLLSTEYAINSTEVSYVKKTQSLAKQSFVRTSQRQSKKEFSPVISASSVKRALKTSWKISLAKSLWSDSKVNRVICKNACFSAKKGGFFLVQGQTQRFQSRHSCLKAKKGRSSTFLEESVRDKVCQTAQQIHALLALEPEWQAVFVLLAFYRRQRKAQPWVCKTRFCLPFACQTGYKTGFCKGVAFGKGGACLWQRQTLHCQEKIVNDLVHEQSLCILSKTSSAHIRKDQISLCNQSQDRALNCAVVGAQLLRPQSSAQALLVHDCVSVKPELVIKQIREHLEGAFPKYVVTASIKEWLHTIDHQALINQLNTFPEMRKRIHGWLKAGILQTNQIALQGVRNPLNKGKTKFFHQNMCFRARYANLWRRPILGKKSESVKLSSQAGSSSPYPKYSLYSAFPKTLWKELDRVYDVMQIENQGQVKEHVIPPFLTRIVLHGLQEQVERCADKLLSVGSKQNALCLRQGKQLCFVSLKCIRREFVDKHSTGGEKSRESSNLSNPCFFDKRSSSKTNKAFFVLGIKTIL